MSLKNKSPYLLFSFAFVLFTLQICQIDRFFWKKNHTFCLQHIYTSAGFDHLAEKSECILSDEVFNQKFTYLGKGLQSFAFLSEDGKYVIKFYRFPTILRPFSFSKIFSFLHASKKNIQTSVQKTLRVFESYKIAYENLAEETGLLLLHLNQTSNLKKKIVLVDRLGVRYQIDLDSTCFILQKKAELIFPFLEGLIRENNLDEAKKIITQIFEIIISRCNKGIEDTDPILEKNLGLIDGKAVHIDIGGFTNAQKPINYQKEIITITWTLRKWLQERSPELFSFCEEEVNNFFKIQ